MTPVDSHNEDKMTESIIRRLRGPERSFTAKHHLNLTPDDLCGIMWSSGPAWLTAEFVKEEGGGGRGGLCYKEDSQLQTNKTNFYKQSFRKTPAGWEKDLLMSLGNTAKTTRPAIVETYKFMGGVDLLDTLSALYKFSFKTRRWYM